MKDGSPILRPRLIPGKGSPFLGGGGKEKKDSITATLVANAGVMVEHNGIGLLVDGIHHEKGHPFSPVSFDDLRSMREGGGIFRNLSYLLFTHEHPDHFSPDQVSEFLQSRSIKGIFLPSEKRGSSALTRLNNELRQQAIPSWELSLAPGKQKRITLTKDIEVTAIGGRHMGPQFNHIPHDSFLLTLHGKSLLFTGDADHVPEYFWGLRNITSLDAMFVNPIFYHHPDGRTIIKDLRPRRTVIYHMPFAGDDTMNFHYSVQSDIRKHSNPGNRPEVFSTPGQTLLL